MYKKILVPLDTSKLSEIALPYAEVLATKLGSEIVLLHVKAPIVSPDKIDHQIYMDKIAGEVEESTKSSPAFKKGEKISVRAELQGPPSVMANPAEANPLNPSTRRLVTVKVRKVEGDEALVGSTEYWYLRWWSTRMREYIYAFRQTSRVTYELRNTPDGWRVHANLRPSPRTVGPNRRTRHRA